ASSFGRIPCSASRYPSRRRASTSRCSIRARPGRIPRRTTARPASSRRCSLTTSPRSTRTRRRRSPRPHRSPRRLTLPGPRAALPRPDLPLPRPLLAEPGVLAQRDRAQLTLELAPAVETLARQLAGLDRGEHGAPGLVHVRAVGEAAARGELLDVGERR